MQALPTTSAPHALKATMQKSPKLRPLKLPNDENNAPPQQQADSPGAEPLPSKRRLF